MVLTSLYCADAETQAQKVKLILSVTAGREERWEINAVLIHSQNIFLDILVLSEQFLSLGEAVLKYELGMGKARQAKSHVQDGLRLKTAVGIWGKKGRTLKRSELAWGVNGKTQHTRGQLLLASSCSQALSRLLPVWHLVFSVIT